MPSSFPGAADSFTTHHDTPLEVIEASTVNAIQDSIVATQNFLLGFDPAHSLHDQLAPGIPTLITTTTTPHITLATATSVGFGFAVAGYRQAADGFVQCQGYINFSSGGGVFLTGLPHPADGANHRFTVALEDGSQFAVTAGSGAVGAEEGTVELFANGSLELNSPDQASGMRIHLDTITYYGVLS